MPNQCEICSKKFVPKNYWQKYCSKRCNMLAWAKRELSKKKGVKK